MEAAPLTTRNIETMAELMYMSETENPNWQAMKEEQRIPWRKKIMKFLDNLAKIDFEPRPKDEFKAKREIVRATKLDLTNFIQDWIKLKIKVPKNLVQIFPSGELANDVVDKFGEIKKNV